MEKVLHLAQTDLVLFAEITGDLLKHPQVQSMEQWLHHGKITCLAHSLSVAVISFQWARKLRLDHRAVARAGLLHDFYLYHKRDKSQHSGWQVVDHPKIAVVNGEKITHLSDKERNIILSHMWPFSATMPHCPEAVLVNSVDTFCAMLEFTGTSPALKIQERLDGHLGKMKA